MKKALYMTTALAAASVLAFGATDAMAAEKAKAAEPIKIAVGGFFNTMAGFSEQASSFESTNNSTARVGYDSFNVYTDSEIYFTGSTKLDNGLTVAVTVQLEADSTGTGTIDHSYIALSTDDFGTIRVGATTFAGLEHNAPGAGAISISGGDTDNWIIKPSAITGTSGTTRGPGDSTKVVYVSPAFAGGWQVGGSYRPSSASSSKPGSTGGTAGTDTQLMEATVAYNGTFGKTTIGADVGYWEQHGNASSSFKSVRTGLSLGFGDVTIGMSYKDTQDLDGGSPGITTNGQESFEVGVSYAAGDMTVGTKYFNSKSPQTTAISGSDQVDKMSVGATYSLGAGVTLAGSIVHVEWDDETTADANNNAGWAAVGGLKIAF